MLTGINDPGRSTTSAVVFKAASVDIPIQVRLEGKGSKAICQTTVSKAQGGISV